MAAKKEAKKKDAAAADDEGTPGKSRKNLVLILLVVVAVGVAGYLKFMAPPSTEVVAGEPTTTTTVPGPVVVLEPITLNVPGGHYLKVGLALQLGVPEDGAEEAPADQDPKQTHARALDAAIDVFGGSPYEELVTPAGREKAKVALMERLKEPYDGLLQGVFFTDFVLQ